MREVRRHRWQWVVLASAIALLSPGCRDALGPEKMITTSVQGTITQAGKPLTQGWIEFIPIDGTVGRMRSARIQKDGSFQATKVPVGYNLIRLVNADIEHDELRRGLGSFSSPIRRTIVERPGGDRVEIDVFVEYSKAAESKQRTGSAVSDPRQSR